MVYFRGWRAGMVLKMDTRKKRDPLVSERIQHLKDYNAWMQLMMQNPAARKKLGPDMEQQMKGMVASLPRLEQLVKKNPTLTMNQLSEASKNPELQQPRIRTRPGPPQTGRRRY
ncbi:MAG: hypothetical protein M3Y56_00725 [Armatimonadota bacterium]|nr:hypothetical protein [Armatimonadota bacterium]